MSLLSKEGAAYKKAVAGLLVAAGTSAVVYYGYKRWQNPSSSGSCCGGGSCGDTVTQKTDETSQIQETVEPSPSDGPLAMLAEEPKEAAPELIPNESPPRSSPADQELLISFSDTYEQVILPPVPTQPNTSLTTVPESENVSSGTFEKVSLPPATPASTPEVAATKPESDVSRRISKWNSEATSSSIGVNRSSEAAEKKVPPRTLPKPKDSSPNTAPTVSATFKVPAPSPPDVTSSSSKIPKPLSPSSHVGKSKSTDVNNGHSRGDDEDDDDEDDDEEEDSDSDGSSNSQVLS